MNEKECILFIWAFVFIVGQTDCYRLNEKIMVAYLVSFFYKIWLIQWGYFSVLEGHEIVSF